MQSSKHQDPSSRETSSSKLQQPSSRFLFTAWWDEEQIDGAMVSNEEPKDKLAGRHAFDLEERTAIFGEKVVRFSKQIPRNPTNDRLIDQLVGCGTSVGANL